MIDRHPPSTVYGHSSFCIPSAGYYVPPNYPAPLDILSRLSTARIRFQDPAARLWYQLMNLAEGPGNYRESSASAMFAYGFAKALRKGYLASEYLSAARRAFRGCSKT